MPSKKKRKHPYSPGALLLMEYRIPAGKIAELRNPPKCRSAVQHEISGRTPLTAETLAAISTMSGGDLELVANVKRLARASFMDRFPHRPERHAFREHRSWEASK